MNKLYTSVQNTLLFKGMYSHCKPNKLDLTAEILVILACG